MIALATPPAAQVAAPEAPSCASCRRSRAAHDNLYCGEQRSNAYGGVVVIGVKKARVDGTYDQVCRNVAERCKYYQEEQ